MLANEIQVRHQQETRSLQLLRCRLPISTISVVSFLVSRHAGHCRRSRDELIRDVLLWIPTHGRAKAGRPARTYIQQLCEDTGCCPEELPRAMNDREEWRERVRISVLPARYDDDDDDDKCSAILHQLSSVLALVSSTTCRNFLVFLPII